MKFNLFSAQVNFFRFSRKIVCLKMSTSTEEVVNKPREYSEREYSEQNDFVKWRKAKKVAVMASFVGKDYLGMQRYVTLLDLIIHKKLTFLDLQIS